jgi:hypothetical protein
MHINKRRNILEKSRATNCRKGNTKEEEINNPSER